VPIRRPHSILQVDPIQPDNKPTWIVFSTMPSHPSHFSFLQKKTLMFHIHLPLARSVEVEPEDTQSMGGGGEDPTRDDKIFAFVFSSYIAFSSSSWNGGLAVLFSFFGRGIDRRRFVAVAVCRSSHGDRPKYIQGPVVEPRSASCASAGKRAERSASITFQNYRKKSIFFPLAIALGTFW